MDESRQWHRLFGLSWADFFAGLPVTVEVEKDLSLKQQFLDVILIKKAAGPLPCRLPDGFEDLAAHNLISFKSYQEALDGWSLNELVGHYVNYRKQVSPTMQDLLPEAEFRLYAVSVRYPQGLRQGGTLRKVQDGVYEVDHFTGRVRVVVVHQLPQQEQNALLHLFSAKRDSVGYGATHYHLRSGETSTFLFQLFERYQREGVPMAFSLEEFSRQILEEMMRKAPVEKRLEGLSPEQRLGGLSPKEFLDGLPPEKRAEFLRLLQAAIAPPKQP